MLLMVEKGIRGGVSKISHRYGKANNKYMGEKFDPSKPSKYLGYFDRNNIYGEDNPLPTHGFEWMKPCELVYWRNFHVF